VEHIKRLALRTAATATAFAIGCSLAGCKIPVWGEVKPVKVTGYIPYVESVTFPEEVHAYRYFEATIRMSTALCPGLLDDGQYCWRDADLASTAEVNTQGSLNFLRLEQSADLGLWGESIGSPNLDDDDPSAIRYGFSFPAAGRQTVRLMSASTPDQGGMPVELLLYRNEGYESWTFPNGFPPQATYREFAVDVLPGEFDDLYYYGYVPYIEEIIAPQQLMTSETAYALLRLSSQREDGSAEAELISQYDGASGNQLLIYPDNPPAGEHAWLLDGIAWEPSWTIGMVSAVTRELGGLELVFLKHPLGGESLIKAGQTGYEVRTHSLEVIPYQPHLQDETWEIRLPYITGVELPPQLVVGQPNVIRIQLAAELQGLSQGLGYYLVQATGTTTGDVLPAAPYYEPHPQGRPAFEMLYFFHGLDAGDYVLRVVSAPTPAQGGMAVMVTPATSPELMLPAGAVYREFGFTVESGE
jgi:hypothetical protein